MTTYLWTLAGLLFVNELVMLGVLGGATWILLGRGWAGVLAGIVSVVIVVTLWAVFASPKPLIDWPAAKYAVRIALYAAATALFAVAGARMSPVWGFALSSLALNVAAVLPPYRDFYGAVK